MVFGECCQQLKTLYFNLPFAGTHQRPKRNWLLSEQACRLYQIWSLNCWVFFLRFQTSSDNLHFFKMIYKGGGEMANDKKRHL